MPCSAFTVKKVLIISSIVMLIVATALIARLVLRPSPGLGFLGTPTRTNGTAWLTITNTTDVSLYFLVKPAQARSNGVWIDVEQSNSVTSSSVLPRGSTTNLGVEVPSGGDAWRLPIVWCRKPDVQKDKAKREIMALLGKHVFLLNEHTNYWTEVQK